MQYNTIWTTKTLDDGTLNCLCVQRLGNIYSIIHMNHSCWPLWFRMMAVCSVSVCKKDRHKQTDMRTGKFRWMHKEHILYACILNKWTQTHTHTHVRTQAQAKAQAHRHRAHTYIQIRSLLVCVQQATCNFWIAMSTWTSTIRTYVNVHTHNSYIISG